MANSDREDIASFLNEMGDVRPLPENDKVYRYNPDESLALKEKRATQHQREVMSTLTPLSIQGVIPLKPDDFLSYQQPGIQDGVFKNLRLGKYPIEQRLSLKGLTVEESRDSLYRTIVQCHSKGTRTLLVQHGRGEQSKPFPALKKSYLNHWLLELEEVIAFHTAQPAHGGTGATYVLLKKHPEQKQINREMNRRR